MQPCPSLFERPQRGGHGLSLALVGLAVRVRLFGRLRLVLRLGGHQRHAGFKREQFGKRFGQFRADDIARHDPDFFEDRHHEQRLHAFRRVVVQPLRVVEQRQRVVKALCERRHFNAELGYDLFRSGDLASDALLIRLELVQLDRVCVVGVFVLLARLFELSDAYPLLGNRGFVAHMLGGEVFEQHLPHGLHPLRWNLYAHPVIAYGLLNQTDRHITLRARGFVGLTAEAVEVRVACAETIFRHDNAEATAAHCTEQVTLQVMRPLMRLVLVLVAGVEQCLYSVERGFVNQRFMVALVFNPVIRHNPGVIPIVQHPVHGLRQQGPLGQILICPHSQAQIVQGVRNIGDRANAGIVQSKSLGNKRSGEVVHHYDADILAVARVAGILVANRHDAGRAAILNFLTQALFGFFAQVGRVPFGNVAHDAMHQLARRRIVNVLGCRYQAHAVLGKEQIERHVIGAVARQAVELVDDDVLNIRVVCDVLEHVLQTRTVGRACTLAPVDELFDDDRADFIGLALRVFALRLN